ncbi:hypothetical protein B0H10DRAFT_2011110 [Mycena sp. CBHHK59/15]|nr:hypothetical protein B0H10DRAFT_2011110 [Mycena sp. CBHHK59/15]
MTSVPSYTQYPASRAVCTAWPSSCLGDSLNSQPQSRPPPQYFPLPNCSVNSQFTSAPKHCPTLSRPPPPYATVQKTFSATAKKPKSTRWNPFSRKHSSSNSEFVSPHGLPAEMLDPEDRAWS